MSMTVRVGEAEFSQGAAQRITELLLSGSSGKGTAASILNRESEKLRDIATRKARTELKDRSDERRTVESKAHGAKYDESFEIVPARRQGYRLIVEVRNTHPFARAVENGTPPHAIPARQTVMAFPFLGPGRGGGPGNPGTFAVEFGEAPISFPRVVQHPGATGRHIMGRSLQEWQRTTLLRRGV